MKKTKIIYWIFTGLSILTIAPGAVFNAISAPESVEVITKLGYPTYVTPFVGVAKLLGVIGILIPGYPRVREWAYAGLMFDLVAAMYSLFMAGESSWPVMLVFIAPLIGSYIYAHKLQQQQTAAVAA